MQNFYCGHTNFNGTKPAFTQSAIGRKSGKNRNTPTDTDICLIGEKFRYGRTFGFSTKNARQPIEIF